jgi:hypothetical protein
MLFTAQHEIPIWELKQHHDNGIAVLEYIKNNAAMELGKKICEAYPFEFIKGVDDGRDPLGFVMESIGDMESYPCHKIITELVVFRREDWAEFKRKIGEFANNQLTDKLERKLEAIFYSLQNK